MYYFAYGSNMSFERINARIDSAQPVGVATLSGHRLKFHKVSADGSGKCDAEYTGNPDDRIIGVVFKLNETDQKRLDSIEGVNHGYEKKWETVTLTDGKGIQAVFYCATDINPNLKPYIWYKDHVLHGAITNNLPKEYVEAIEATEAIPDNNRRRDERERAIRRSGPKRA